jgi:hypothetical protein
MYDILNISDKYKVLYFNDKVKDSFMNMFLIGLDNSYLDIDMETLNNSSKYYRERLNKKFMNKFNKNFNLNNNRHLSYLSEVCGVDISIQNGDKKRETPRNNKKMLYFIKNDTGYGLVLKNNKKSYNTELLNTELPALEKLSIEGGDNTLLSGRVPNRGSGPSEINESNNENNKSNNVINASNNENNEPPVKKSKHNNGYTWRGNSLVNNNRQEQRDAKLAVTDISKKLDLIVKEINKINEINNSVREGIKNKHKQNILQNLEKDIKEEYIDIDNYVNMKQIIKTIYNTQFYTLIDDNYIDNFKIFLKLFDLKIKSLNISSNKIENISFTIDKNLEIIKEKLVIDIDDIDDIDDIYYNLIRGNRNELDNNILNEIKAELLVDSLYINNIDNTYLFNNCVDYDNCIMLEEINKNGGQEQYNIEDKEENNNYTKQKGGNNDNTYFNISELDNKFPNIDNKISYLLENGIDSTHDFAKHDIKNDDENKLKISSKKTLFNLFWSGEEKAVSLNNKISKIFNNFNNCVITNMVKKNKLYKYGYEKNLNLDYVLNPSITDMKYDSNLKGNSKYWPFTSGWERYATLYYTQGLDNKHFGHDIYKQCSTNNKVLIISQDSQGGSTGLLNFLGNVIFLPETIKTSINNILINNNKKLDLIKQVETISKISLSNDNNTTLRNLIVNIIIKHEAKKFGVNFISSNNSLYWNNPSQLIDAAGSYGKNKDDFINELKEINSYLNTNGNETLELKELKYNNNIQNNNINIDKDLNKLIEQLYYGNNNNNQFIKNIKEAFNLLISIEENNINELNEEQYKQFVLNIFRLSLYNHTDKTLDYFVPGQQQTLRILNEQYKNVTEYFIDSNNKYNEDDDDKKIYCIPKSEDDEETIKFINYHIYNIQQLLIFYNPTKFKKGEDTINVRHKRNAEEYKISKKNIIEYFNNLKKEDLEIIQKIIKFINENIISSINKDIKNKLDEIIIELKYISAFMERFHENINEADYNKLIEEFYYKGKKYYLNNNEISLKKFDENEPQDIIEALKQSKNKNGSTTPNTYNEFKKKTQFHFISIDDSNDCEYIVNRMNGTQVKNLTGLDTLIWNASMEKKKDDTNYIKIQLNSIYILLDNIKDKESKSPIINVKKENLYKSIKSLNYKDRNYKNIRMDVLPDFQLFSRLYSLKYGDDNLLKETYDTHFEQLSEYIKKKLSKEGENQSINFEFMMIQYFNYSVDSIFPCLIIRRMEENTIEDRIEIDYVKLGEIGTITEILKILEESKIYDKPIEEKIEQLNRNKYPNEVSVDKFYDCKTELLRLNTFLSYFTMKNEDRYDVFKRILYTFKMLGDQGQVNFFKVLKDKPDFNSKFELLLTTHDSLCRLYACTKGVSNMTMTEHNFPSEHYCKSNPRGMVYYNKNKNYDKKYLQDREKRPRNNTNPNKQALNSQQPSLKRGRNNAYNNKSLQQQILKRVRTFFGSDPEQ